MANVSITAGSVIKGSNAKTSTGLAGEAITAGQAVYIAADKTVRLADADSADALVRVAKGVSLNGAAVGQPVTYQTEGDYTAGGTLTKGLVYVLSTTAGAIAPAADLASGNYTCILGVAKSASVLALNIQSAGVAV